MFDSVNRDALWRILDLCGVPPKLINLMSELYSRTEKCCVRILTQCCVRYGGTISDLFPVVTGVRQGCILAPTLFNACMDRFMGRRSERSSCGVSFGSIKISGLISQRMQSSLQRLWISFGAQDMLNEESEPLGFRVSWVKTTIQAFSDTFDAAILSVPVCGEEVEVTERFTYIGSDIHVSAGCEPEVNRCLGQAWRVMD